MSPFCDLLNGISVKIFGNSRMAHDRFLASFCKGQSVCRSRGYSSEAIRRLANELHRLNNAVIAAVDLGLSVELQRGSRHNAEGGFWGELMIPIVVKQA